MKRTIPILMLAAALSVSVAASSPSPLSQQTPSVADLKKEAELQKKEAKAKDEWAKAEEKVKKLEEELRKAKEDATLKNGRGLTRRRGNARTSARDDSARSAGYATPLARLAIRRRRSSRPSPVSLDTASGVWPNASAIARRFRVRSARDSLSTFVAMTCGIAAFVTIHW